jgi:hypothetical protein
MHDAGHELKKAIPALLEYTLSISCGVTHRILDLQRSMPSAVKLEQGNRPVTSQTAPMEIYCCLSWCVYLLTGGEI